MLSAEAIDQAARHLLAARKAKTPGPRLPETYRPIESDSALAIHERVLELLGETVGGWKCGLPDPIAGPVVAALPKSAILYSGPYSVPGARGQIEPEIAFVISRDLPPRATPYSDSEIRGAIGEARLVLELIATRYADKASAAPPEILADAANNHGLIVGPVIANALGHSIERLHVTIRTSADILFDDERAHPSGHPLKALAWLVRFLNGRGQGLKAGQIVTTGSYAGVVNTPLETPIQVKMKDLASIEIELVTDQP